MFLVDLIDQSGSSIPVEGGQNVLEVFGDGETLNVTTYVGPLYDKEGQQWLFSRRISCAVKIADVRTQAFLTKFFVFNFSSLSLARKIRSSSSSPL